MVPGFSSICPGDHPKDTDVNTDTITYRLAMRKKETKHRQQTMAATSKPDGCHHCHHLFQLKA